MNKTEKRFRLFCTAIVDIDEDSYNKMLKKLPNCVVMERRKNKSSTFTKGAFKELL
jgi:hypothetical protein